MKFTKTAAAVAIAGFAAVPLTASAETTLSGLVQIKVQGNDADAGGEGPDDGDLNMAAGDVRMAINSQNEIVGGLTGYGNIQFNLDNLTGEGGVVVEELGNQEDTRGGVDTTATVAADNIYVGIKGGFGDLRFGEIPLAVEYGQVANDIYDVGATVVDGFSYVGAFGPVGIIANYSLEGPNPGGAIDDTAVDNDNAGDSDMAGIGAKFTLAGVTIGAGYELRNLGEAGDTTSTGNFAVGATFALAGFSIGAHYWLQEGADGDIDFDPDGADELSEEGDLQSIAVQVGYGIAGVNLGLTYARLTTDITNVTGDDTNDASTIRLDAGYDLGGGLDVSTRISAINDDPADDDSSDLVEYRVQLTKNF